EEAQGLMSLHAVAESELPLVVFEDGSALRDPDTRMVAERIGLQHTALHALYDVAIIGAGPAGLAAAVYGASEGLKTILVERRAPGGQAGTSSRIENYLGFPKGLSGADLTRRAIAQATRFGTEFLSPQEVTNIAVKDGYKILQLGDGTTLNARSAIVTTGVDYRKLDSTGLDEFAGAGVYYGAATTEAANFVGQEVYVVGGGNSAGQAAMYLSQFAARVHIVIRREDLTSTMSSYLIDQIVGTPNINLEPFAVVAEAKGAERLEHLVLEDLRNQERREVAAAALFVFIGAKPYTDWLQESIIKDKRGFVVTGQELKHYPEFPRIWKEDRDPYLLETCQPGIFAAGDVRSGAMNRVASAVGEGAMAISFVHQYLAAN
ncbi:MAG: FAD-dependent oxidoreductase, partial [Bacteroidetes bacterium]|nr:FAD-dependent oxidoreductase [Bacteroidota bacterium]